MMLDIKTLMMLYLIINVISAGAVAIIWWQNRGRFAGSWSKGLISRMVSGGVKSTPGMISMSVLLIS